MNVNNLEIHSIRNNTTKVYHTRMAVSGVINWSPLPTQPPTGPEDEM